MDYIPTYDLEDGGYGHDEEEFDPFENVREYGTLSTNDDSAHTSTAAALSSQPTISEGGNQRKKRSEVWKHFTQSEKVVNGVKIQRAICKYCGKDYADTKNGTSHLRNHGPKCAEKHKGKSDPRQSTLHLGGGSNVGAFAYNQARMREGLATFISSSELPFSFAEDPNFSEFVKEYLNPQFHPISRNTERSDTMKLFLKKKNELLTSISKYNPKIACTSDTWSGRNHMGFYVLTAHYIDENWMLQKRIIAFRRMEHPHTGHAIYTHITNVLTEYNFEKNIFSITFDNASANTSAIDLFKRNIHHPLTFEFFHIRCACHIINLLVQSGIDECSDIITKIRDSIIFIMSSNSRIEDFAKFCKNSCYKLKGKKFATDTSNRWNTTYLMIKSCKSHQQPISDFITVRGSKHVSVIESNEWAYADQLMDFLEVFYNATLVCSGVYYPTTNLILQEMYNMTQTWHHYANDINFAIMVVNMEENFLKYWENVSLLYILATIMDPRLKLEGAEAFLTGIRENHITKPIQFNMEEIKEKLNSIYNKYEDKYGSTVRSSFVSESSSSTHSSKFIKPIWSVLAQKNKQKSSLSSISDLHRYLGSEDYFEPDDRDNLDVLKWWKSNSKVYPVLSIMARDMLTPPVSSVASEAAFSAGNRTMDERRCTMLPESLEAQICIADWKRAARRNQDQIPDHYDLDAEFKNLELDENFSSQESTTAND